MAREFEVKTRLTAEDAASDTIQGVEKSLEGVDKAAVSTAEGLGVAAAAVATTVAALKLLASASAEQEDALQRLDSALRLKGAEAFATALRAQADEIQRTSRFTDDAVNSAQALITTYGVAGEQLTLATQAAADRAARLGIDLQTAAAQVAGSVNGFTRGVDRVVPSLKSMSDEALRSGKGIEAIAEAMRGGAVEAAATLAGQFDRLTQSLGERTEKTGDWFIQNDFVRNGMEGLIQAVQGLAGSLEKSGAAYDGAAASAAALTAAQAEQLRTVTKLSEIQDRSTRIMSEYATAQQRAATIAAELGITLERDVIAKREREAELYRELADLERQGVDVRIAATASIESEGEAIDGANVSRQFAIGLMNQEIGVQAALARQVIFTAQSYEYLARTQGYAAATDAAVAAGGRTILGGTRVLLPGGGSRLTHPPGFGRFGD